MLKVSKRTLLLVAGIVWLIAGGNIAWLGIRSFAQMDRGIWWLLVIGAVGVFTLFHVKVFSKMVGKHAVRIAGYEADRVGVWNFFDVPGYAMMAIMMTGGISLRAFGLVPVWFIAFFYTGLGIALALSGASFLIRFARRRQPSRPCPLVPRAASRIIASHYMIPLYHEGRSFERAFACYREILAKRDPGKELFRSGIS